MNETNLHDPTRRVTLRIGDRYVCLDDIDIEAFRDEPEVFIERIVKPAVYELLRKP